MNFDQRQARLKPGVYCACNQRMEETEENEEWDYVCTNRDCKIIGESHNVEEVQPSE